ncbi:hypothetical protein KIW84_010307 [Lathyrus oleraceus]|uniref:BAH domain-containing protein n=1 Tax=Pisum sativum TaxID=3888 RepID=A0A9D5B9K7_PEA|nr:hypothetical protein KIW84_010307 [Pisum sativum]
MNPGQKLHSRDLWAARIESIWKDVDDSYWCRVQWYIIQEETSVGRQPHNLSKGLYRTNDSSNIEMGYVLRHCYIMTLKEYAKASNEGDDVFLCEYEYDIHWHSFKRLADIDDEREDSNESDDDEYWNISKKVKYKVFSPKNLTALLVKSGVAQPAEENFTLGIPSQQTKSIIHHSIAAHQCQKHGQNPIVMQPNQKHNRTTAYKPTDPNIEGGDDDVVLKTTPVCNDRHLKVEEIKRLPVSWLRHAKTRLLCHKSGVPTGHGYGGQPPALCRHEPSIQPLQPSSNDGLTITYHALTCRWFD